MAYISLTTSQVDKKSPIDDTLMGTIKADMDDIDSRIINNSELSAVDFRIEGPVDAPFDQFDGKHAISKACTVERAILMADNSGTAGTFTVTINRGGVSGSTSQTKTLAANSGAANYTAYSLTPISCAIGDYVWVSLTVVPSGVPENFKVRVVLT